MSGGKVRAGLLEIYTTILWSSLPCALSVCLGLLVLSIHPFPHHVLWALQPLISCHQPTETTGGILVHAILLQQGIQGLGGSSGPRNKIIRELHGPQGGREEGLLLTEKESAFG